MTYHIKTISPVAVCSPSGLYNNRLSAAPSKILFDAESDKSDVSLEDYFKDVYMIFVKQLADFALKAESSDAEHKRLQKLMNELIWIRNLMQK